MRTEPSSPAMRRGSGTNQGGVVLPDADLPVGYPAESLAPKHRVHLGPVEMGREKVGNTKTMLTCSGDILKQ
jgi:hypothetical protein